MVWLSPGLWAKSAKNVKIISKRMRNQFVDTLRLTCKGGHGGNGVPKYGGIGGQGGCVYFVATEEMTLEKLMKKHPDKRISAGHGEDSSKLRLLGRRGLDRRIEVPSGVALLHEGRCLAELNEADATCVVAGGGIGGCTSNSFLGHAGESRTISLDLKLIADVGLVGFPNAGKSTLLKAISNASPKIASYPFTTIRPQIGTVNYPDLRQITVADLPGLIEGAHANIGMGHKFLKHVERTRLLLMVVDVHGFRLSPKHAQRSCVENVLALAKELELYDETLLSKPCVLLVNKIDTLGQAEQLECGAAAEGQQQQQLVAAPTAAESVEAASQNAREVRELVQRLWRLDQQQDDCPAELRSTRLPQFERIIAISAQQQTNIAEAKRVIREVLDESAERELLATENRAAEEAKDGVRKTTTATVHRKL